MLCNQKFNYRVYKWASLDFILSQITPPYAISVTVISVPSMYIKICRRSFASHFSTKPLYVSLLSDVTYRIKVEFYNFAFVFVPVQ
jgi:hypothetical protein